MKIIYLVILLIGTFLLIVSITIIRASQDQDKTLANLQAAYNLEATDSWKYMLFARKASEENLEEIAKLFSAISEAESVHTYNYKEILIQLGTQPNEIPMNEPIIKSTKENIESTIKDYNKELTDIYPEFIEDAKNENIPVVTSLFKQVLTTETEHKNLLENAYTEIEKKEPIDYYVSSQTGKIIIVKPNESAPESNDKNEEYTKF